MNEHVREERTSERVMRSEQRGGSEMRGRLRRVVVPRPRPSTTRRPRPSETIKYTRHHSHCHRFLVQRARYFRADRLRSRCSSSDFACSIHAVPFKSAVFRILDYRRTMIHAFDIRIRPRR